MGMEEFMALYQFAPENTEKVGVEIECHLAENGQIAPIAHRILMGIKTIAPELSDCFTYELSACQLEWRTPEACPIENLRRNILEVEGVIKEAEKKLRFSRIFCPVAPEDMPLDVYPDTRYLGITKDLPRQVLLAACRVAGVHIHIGMPSHAEAMAVYNKAVESFKYLCRLGATDQRISEYCRAAIGMNAKMDIFQKHMITKFFPPRYANWEEFYQRAVNERFDNDPRQLWDFIRISKHGTIEFRMFDTTEDIDEIVFWARVCYGICQQALAQNVA
ncbi:amidoligase family protein [Candidatus Microgenomates bacterium]|nr:amidoligase family protein [Candidatus Microgenomates bacterium]